MIPEEYRNLLALSVRQPWATSIVHFGKPVENRVWKGTYLKMQMGRMPVGTQFLIHSSKGITQDDIDEWKDLLNERPLCKPTWDRVNEAGTPKYRDLPRGGIIGVARFVGWVTEHSSPWFVGPGALVLDEVKALPFTPCKGMLGFFKPVLPPT